MKEVNNFFSATAVAIVVIFFALALSSCKENPPVCPAGTKAVEVYSNVSGTYQWICQECGCNNPNPNSQPNPDHPGPGEVIYNFHGSVFETALLTSTAAQRAFAFEQGTGNVVLDMSGNPLTSPKIYILDVNPWNGVSFFPTANNGQAMITNYGTSQGQGLYNRLVSELQQTAKANALANTVTYINTGIWNANYYYVVVKLRKNADGSAVGKTETGVHVYQEITGYEIVTGTNAYFW